jgi:hypothetical protein
MKATATLIAASCWCALGNTVRRKRPAATALAVLRKVAADFPSLPGYRLDPANSHTPRESCWRAWGNTVRRIPN